MFKLTFAGTFYLLVLGTWITYIYLRHNERTQGSYWLPSTTILSAATSLRLINTPSSCMTKTLQSKWQKRLNSLSHLNHRFRCLSGHVLNSILISQPIRTFDCVIKVPPPVIIFHVTKSCIYTSLKMMNPAMYQASQKTFNQVSGQ